MIETPIVSKFKPASASQKGPVNRSCAPIRVRISMPPTPNATTTETMVTELRTDQGEDLDASDPERDHHRDDGHREVVVHLAYRVDERPSVRRPHDHAVRRVDEAHPAGDHQRQDQDRPDWSRERQAD